MINKFYIYRHIRLDTNTPFHVGKGFGRRAYQKTCRNLYWHNIAKNGYEIEIILENLTEDEAFAKEKEFIKLYKSLGYCETNFTDGGEGTSGHKHTEEIKCHWSKIRKGRPSLKKGIPISEEQKLKISNTLKGHKQSEETINKRIKSITGIKKKPMSEQGRNNIKQAIVGKRQGKLNGMFGKKQTEETKNKIKEKALGRKLPPRTEEYKQKISELKKRWWENKRND